MLNLQQKGRCKLEAASNELNHIEFDLIVSSPLSRALQTYEIIFSKRDIDLKINPLHREHVVHSCDIGKQPDELKKIFPNLNFEKLEKYWWNNGKKIEEKTILFESIAELDLRVKKFQKFIKNREEKRIAIIGHGTFYSKIIGYYLNNCEYKIIKNN